MEGLGHWLLSVTAAALLAGLLKALMPPGPVQAVGVLGCSLLLFLTMARPVLSLRWEMLTGAVEDYQRQTEQLQQALEQTSADLELTIIASRSGAYSEDVTAGLDARVELLWTADRPPRLTGARITGALSAQERAELGLRLCRELGLEESQITWDTEETP